MERVKKCAKTLKSTVADTVWPTSQTRTRDLKTHKKVFDIDSNSLLETEAHPSLEGNTRDQSKDWRAGNTEGRTEKLQGDQNRPEDGAK